MIKSAESTNGGIGLKTLRELLGDISQEELARRINASLRTVHRWESGQTARLSMPQIKALDAQLGSVGLRFKDLSDDLSVETPAAQP